MMSAAAIIGAYSRALCLVAAMALAVLMMGVTVVDVTLRWFGSGIPGAYEIVAFGMRFLVPLAWPLAFHTGANIAVDMFVDLLPPGIQDAVFRGGMLMAAACMAYFSYAITQRAVTVYQSNGLTPDLLLPEYFFAAPLVVGSVLSVPVALFLAAKGASAVAPE